MSFMEMHANIDTKYKSETPSPPPRPAPHSHDPASQFLFQNCRFKPGRPKVPPPPQAADIYNMRVKKETKNGITEVLSAHALMASLHW